MLASLLKILAFVAVVAALTLGVIELMRLEGGAVIQMGGYEITLGTLELVIAAILLIILGWLAIKLAKFLVATFHFLNGDETAISRYFSRNRERKGYDALSEGILALASGEGRQAMAQADRADRYLDRPELTGVLKAQAAELAGDRAVAEATYKELLGNDRTRFVGVRGIMRQKLEEGDTDTALKLAERAFALKPKHVEVQDTLLRLQAEKSDWSGARKTLNAKLRTGTLPRDVHRRRDAVLALSEARDILVEGKSVEARETAIEANRLSPDLIPATVMAARAYVEQGKPKYAARVIKKAWEVRPHPDLAAAFAGIAPEETPEERIKRFNALTRIDPKHPETRMLLSELHIAAEDFPAARRALGDLPEEDPTARVLTLMAAIERGEGADDAVVRGWLTRALTAPRGEQWVCDNCSHVQAVWSPVCDNCHSFDTMTWKRPAAGEVAMPASTEMLPLLVGADSPSTEIDVVAGPDLEDPETVEAETVETGAEPEITDPSERKDS